MNKAKQPMTVEELIEALELQMSFGLPESLVFIEVGGEQKYVRGVEIYDDSDDGDGEGDHLRIRIII